MKISKFILIGFALIAFSLTSCDKDFVCDCHSHDAESEMEDRKYDFNGKKDEAEEFCEGREKHLTEDHGYTGVHCEVK